MVLEGGFAVGGFDLVGGCGALEVEDLVGVDGRGIRVCDVFWGRHGVFWMFMACFFWGGRGGVVGKRRRHGV